MEIKIQKVWGKVRQDRWGVVVEIDNHGQKFCWMPTYEEIGDLIKKLGEVETLNQKKLKETLLKEATERATSISSVSTGTKFGGNTTTTNTNI